MDSIVNARQGDLVEVIVAGIEAPSHDVRIFELVSKSGTELPAFEAGANVTVYLSSELSRQYSIASNPSELHRYVIAVKLDPKSRGGSDAMHRLSVGQSLQLSLPINAFPLQAADRYLLLGGGIGMTPLLSMAHSLSHAHREFTLHHFARQTEHLRNFDGLVSDGWKANVREHGSATDGPARAQLERLSRSVARGTKVYVCGPAGFIDSVRELMTPAVGEENVHAELFAPRSLGNPGDDGETFSVIAEKSGVTVEVGPGTSIADALRAAGVKVPTSCEMGICGTCIARVIEGEPDHQDDYLSDDEKASGRMIMPCVSRCKSKLLKLDI
jgi:vanillate O-demethylase ferredoxin subunit